MYIIVPMVQYTYSNVVQIHGMYIKNMVKTDLKTIEYKLTEAEEIYK